MHTNKKAVLMISLGTPDSPGWFDVASYLSEFLGDGRIINIPSFLRYLLVNLIIVPTRSFSSSKSYKELWTERGSPLKYHMEDLTAKVQEELKDTHDVIYAMRYKNPSVKDQLKELEKKGYEEIILFPVFPDNKRAIDIICSTVLSLARFETGSFIFPFAKNSLKPEIKIFLVSIIIAAITS